MPAVPAVGGVPGMRELGEYLREQRQNAQLSLRQLSAAAGVSNPYLSQIERGLRRPSAEILAALAKGLQISVESLYVRAGFLDADTAGGQSARTALSADPALSAQQRRILIDLYDTFVGVEDHGPDAAPSSPADPAPLVAPTSTSHPDRSC